ncbi:MAG TPA: hypothetical protein VN256_25975 [Pyrinomonadaceae bacterium]|nr:hypothetical protein [Pyrinomonadaceae bacterium]
MRIEIPAHLIPKLRAMQADWRNNVAKDVGLEDAVLLVIDLFTHTFMTFDGRFLLYDSLEDGPPLETSDPKEAYGAILLGAKRWHAPWLLELLPARPGDAPDCGVCKGKGFISPLKDTQGKPIEFVCHGCGGLGWIPPG